MKLPAFNYVEPATLAEACRTLAAQNGNALIVAGGTELLQVMKHHLKTPQTLVSLERVPGLGEIAYSPAGGLSVGAQVILQDLLAADIVKKRYSLIAAAAQTVGGAQLQAMGTLAGNLCQDALCIYYNRPPNMRVRQGPCHKLGGTVCHAVKRSPDCRAVYSGDLAPALIVLGAEITLIDQSGEKTIPLEEIYSGDGVRPLTLTPGQVIARIHVPERGDRAGGAYMKLRLRKAIDYPLLGVAAAVTLEDDGRSCRSAAVALTGIGSGPIAVPQAAGLQGQPLTDQGIEDLAEAARALARPVANLMGASARYRREMVPVYVKMAVKQALAEARAQGETPCNTTA